ncbi:hypothetical protein V6Z11_D04G143800 [Gossypium hirsutum]
MPSLPFESILLPLIPSSTHSHVGLCLCSHRLKHLRKSDRRGLKLVN